MLFSTAKINIICRSDVAAMAMVQNDLSQIGVATHTWFAFSARHTEDNATFNKLFETGIGQSAMKTNSRPSSTGLWPSPTRSLAARTVL
jgi:hypothetical protein